MAQVSNFETIMFFCAVVVSVFLSVTGVTEQSTKLSPSPSPLPGIDAGAGFLVTSSVGCICSELLISITALLWH
ncbi:hypothetical protein JCGZ_25900 [Jatropha curcas]|uniref:Uncharacterized protein n=1 Tax=Jatropha curcas TaxID=180498 RepID=A0A067JRB0_JATCU|nr:hypothetical protein JCGZ_25900 [Jatropha curcas]